jgi:hypothetical protein
LAQQNSIIALERSVDMNVYCSNAVFQLVQFGQYFGIVERIASHPQSVSGDVSIDAAIRVGASPVRQLVGQSSPA